MKQSRTVTQYPEELARARTCQNNSKQLLLMFPYSLSCRELISRLPKGQEIPYLYAQSTGKCSLPGIRFQLLDLHKRGSQRGPFAHQICHLRMLNMPVETAG